MASRATNEYRQQPESRPDPSMISAEIMEVAEKTTCKEVLFRVHPTLDENEKRVDVILYLQAIAQSIEGVQVIFILSN